MDSTSKVELIFIFMRTERKERRKCERIFFSDKDGITGLFAFPDNYTTVITADITDLGEEGICLILAQDDEEAELLHEGDHLILTEIKGVEALQFLSNMEIEVRWTLNLKHFAAGCEFLNVSQTIKEQLRQFMNLWGKD